MMNSNSIKKAYIGFMVVVAMMITTVSCLQLVVGLESLSHDYVRDVAIDSMGMLICGILLIGIFAGRKDDRQNHAMFKIIICLSILFFVDILSSYFEGDSRLATGVIIVNTIGFIFEDLLVFTYWTYIRDELKLHGELARIAGKFAVIAIVLNIALDFINMKLGIYFKVSEAGEYIATPYEFLTNIAIIAIFIVAISAILHNEHKKVNEKLILMSFEAFPLGAYIVESILGKYTFTYPAYLLSVLLIYIRIFSEKEKKIAEQQVILTKQSTALMISQIQPHFLYNVLTTISNLCATDPEEAEETTVLFSQYLRTNLDSLRNQEPVLFATELMHIKTYVELEKKRFGDILNVEYDIKEQNFKVPSLGIQPIVENSIKHGIRGKNAPGHIKISSYKVDKVYKIIIEDDGIGFDMNMPPKEDGRSHVGMINVKERLKQMCNASMKIESSPGNGCRTEITIPES